MKPKKIETIIKNDTKRNKHLELIKRKEQEFVRLKNELIKLHNELRIYDELMGYEQGC